VRNARSRHQRCLTKAEHLRVHTFTESAFQGALGAFGFNKSSTGGFAKKELYYGRSNKVYRRRARKTLPTARSTIRSCSDQVACHAHIGRPTLRRNPSVRRSARLFGPATAEKLRKRFGVKLELLPIPSGNDFRVQMSAEEQARVAREIDTNVRESLTRGTEDLWRRLREVVSHMVDRLNEPASRFHATLVTNVFDIVELLPRLNVNGDAELNRFAEQARQRLCGFTAHDLKKHDLLRVAAATDAAEMVAEIDSVLRSRETGAPEEEATGAVENILAHMSAYMEAPRGGLIRSNSDSRFQCIGIVHARRDLEPLLGPAAVNLAL
jgi:hypothetical protein